MIHKRSVGLLWKKRRPVAETSTWQHTSLTKDRYPCPGEIRTRNHSKGAVAVPRLRRRTTGIGIRPAMWLIFLMICLSLTHTTFRPWQTLLLRHRITKLHSGKSISATAFSQQVSVHRHSTQIISCCWGTRQNLQIGTITEFFLNLSLCFWNYLKSEPALVHYEHLWGNAFTLTLTKLC
jgi:hypothetical protein